MRRIRLPGLALLLGLALVLFTPAGARAHAFVVQSNPEETGARLGTAPGAVVLTFSEAIQPGLSRAVVTTPDGQSASGSGRGTAISVPLATNAPGVYRVTWKVVSADDGHTTSGSFRFTVGSLRGRIGAGSTGTPAWQSVLFAVGRTVEYTALLLAAGLLLLHWLARRREELAWMNAQLAPRLRVALL